VADESLLSDDLLRQLVAVGHVDVLVGLPTLNNAATVMHVVRAAQAGLARDFPRARTLIFNSDGGSTDGTPALVRDVTAATDSTDTVTASHPLRTTHRITTPYGLPGKEHALRMIFAVADLLSADAVVVLHPDVTSITPDWIAALGRPVRDGAVDFMAPVYQRASTDVPLITQLVRPLIRGVYGWRVREPLAGEFGCSGRFAAHCLEQQVWNSELAREGIDLWVTAEALARGFRPGQAVLGPRTVSRTVPPPALPDVFQQLVSSAFGCLERHADEWLARETAAAVPTFGQVSSCPDGALPDAVEMARGFARDVAALHPVLATILRPATLEGVTTAAASASGGRPAFPSDLWASTVFEFALAHHRAVIAREHITQVLLPLYLGRTAAFLYERGQQGPGTGDDAIEALGQAFEAARPQAAAQWKKA
jgi:hypothetical protein